MTASCHDPLRHRSCGSCARALSSAAFPPRKKASCLHTPLLFCGFAFPHLKMSQQPPLPAWATSKRVTDVPHQVNGCDKLHVPHQHPHSGERSTQGEGNHVPAQTLKPVASVEELLEQPVRGTGAADKCLPAPEDVGPVIASSAADTQYAHQGMGTGPIVKSGKGTATEGSGKSNGQGASSSTGSSAQ